MSNNKKLLGVLTLLMLILVGCSSTNTSSEKNSNTSNNTTYTLKLATGSSPGEPYYEDTIKPWMEKVTEYSDGRVEFEVYPAGQLGSTSEYPQLVRDGVADIATYAAVYMPNEMPLNSQVLAMPGLSEGAYDGTMGYKDIVYVSPLLETDYVNNGVYPVYVQMTQTNDFYTKGKEIRVPDDLKGLQVQGLGGVLNELVKFFGATPVTVTHNDMFEAFDRGVFEVAHIYPSTANAYGISELIDFATVGARAGSGPVGKFINYELWKGFPEEIQDAFHQASNDMAEIGAKANQEDSDEVLKEWEEQGKTIYEIKGEERELWDAKYEEFHKYWVDGLDEDAAKVFEMYKVALEKYQ